MGRIRAVGHERSGMEPGSSDELIGSAAATYSDMRAPMQ